MFKRNWSLWLGLILALGLILGFKINQTMVKTERISIEDSRLADFSLSEPLAEGGDIMWPTEIKLAADETLYDVRSFDGEAFFVVAIDQLREQYAYNYKLYRFGTQVDFLSEFPDAKPHHLNIEAIDANAIIFTKEYSDGKTKLLSYNFSTKQLTEVFHWTGPPSKAAISYHNATIGLIVDGSWHVFNLLGQARPVDYDFPAGAVVKALGPGANELLIYYEVNQLRYLCLYRFLNRNASTFLVNDQIHRIYRQTGWALTQSDNRLQLYTWPDLHVQRINLNQVVERIEILNHELIDFKLPGTTHQHVVFDVNKKSIRFNQLVVESTKEGEVAYHYYSPIMQRINVLLFQ